jgi:hypothetical protein
MCARDDRDRIARRAAAYLHAREVASAAEAIAKAAREMHVRSEGELPSQALVRKHAQGMAMQELGQAGYEAAVRAHLQRAAEVMYVLEEAFGVEPQLMGRAARGHVDGDPVVHIHVRTKAPVGKIAQALVDAGYEEPEFRTIETESGRANQLRFTDEGTTFLLTRK